MVHEENEIIITDINESLVKLLNKEEKQFYENLPSQQKKDYFVHMGSADRLSLMSGKVSAEEEALIWSYASTLALKIYNNGFGLTERVRMIKRIGQVSLIFALIAGLSGIFTSTYVKNHSIQSHMKVTNKNNKGATNE